MSVRLHWHCLSFIASVDGGWATGSTYLGRSERSIPKAAIEDARSGMDKMFASATLISASYLGEMTAHEFMPDDAALQERQP